MSPSKDIPETPVDSVEVDQELGHESSPPPVSTESDADKRRRPTREIKGRGSRAHVSKTSIVVLILAVLVVLALLADLRNRRKYRLVCRNNHFTAQQGARLPWPFGWEVLGGSLKPFPVPPDFHCPDQRVGSLAEVEVAFLDGMLFQVQRELNDPDSGDLGKARLLLTQAMSLSQSGLHNAQHESAKQLLADLNYREGRASLTLLENDLRRAIDRLKEARRLASERYGDLDEWIDHLESVRDAITPAPNPGMPSPPVMPPAGSTPPRTPAAPQTAPPATSPPPAPSPEVPPPPPPPTENGILM